MKFFKNRKTEVSDTQKQKKLFSKNAFKHGGVAIAFTAIVLAVLVGVNLIFGFLAQRTNLNIDISLQGANTLSKENIDFIKALDKEVTVTVCSSEEDYTNGQLGYIAQQYFNAVDQTGEYFEQTINLLNLYEKYSDNVTVRFADPYDPSFAEIEKEYSGSALDMGDIIVECYQNIDGQYVNRSSIIAFDDIYYLYDDGYVQYGNPYTIKGNNIETVLTSAIYKVTSAETKQALIIETHCDPHVATEYGDMLKLNNFDIATYSSAAINEIGEEYDLVIIDAPIEDFLASEIEAIEEWLYNEGIRGKGLMYLASVSSPATPNLDAFLEDWGITYADGVLYETNTEYIAFGDNTSLFFEAAETNGEDNEYDKIVNANQGLVAGGNRPLYQAFEEEGLRETKPIALTATDSVVIAKLSDVGTDWKPDGSFEQQKHIGILLSEETEPIDNVYRTSYVMAFSGDDFVSSYWSSTYTLNRESMISAAKFISGAEDDGITFTMKKMEENTFADVVNEKAADTMKVIFKWGLPVLLIALGVTVFVRRARR